MATRALPVGLLLLTLVMDGQGRHQTALYVLVLALAAARARATAGGAVPALGVSGAVGALLLLIPVLLASAVRTGAPLLRRAQAR